MFREINQLICIQDQHYCRESLIVDLGQMNGTVNVPSMNVGQCQATQCHTPLFSNMTVLLHRCCEKQSVCNINSVSTENRGEVGPLKIEPMDTNPPQILPRLQFLSRQTCVCCAVHVQFPLTLENVI